MSSISIAGGKCASLGELLKNNIPVPPGFAITTETYKRFIIENKIDQRTQRILKQLNYDSLTEIDKASKEIQEMFIETPLSLNIEDQIAEFYRLLSKKCQVPALPVAVRSSATAEDLPGASFAGQQDTYLWIRGIDDVINHVQKCWASLFTSRAIAYRKNMGFDRKDVCISVGVQKMVNSWAAGVMFTLNPTNGDRSTIAIDANWGFGESVVSGVCTPDHFLVNKVTMEIVNRTISVKDCFFTTNFEKQVVEKHNCPPERKRDQCIIDEEIVELAKIGKQIEKHYRKPMDIEWAIDKDLPSSGRVLILQSRPETVWSEKKIQSESKSKISPFDSILSRAYIGTKN